MKKFDLDVESLSTQKNRTIVEQRRVETMIQQLYSEILAKEMKYREKQHMQQEKFEKQLAQPVVIDLDSDGKKNEKVDINELKGTKDDHANTIPNYNLDKKYDHEEDKDEGDDDYEDVSSDDEQCDGDLDEAQAFGDLYKISHAKYLRSALFNLKYNIRYYDCGQPWVVFWIIHSIYLLNEPSLSADEPGIQSELLSIINQSQYPTGGYGGGNHQFPHVASSYAAVCSIIEIGTVEAYQTIDRQGMYDFLVKCKNPRARGGFLLAEGGESDMRGVYIAALLADVLNIKTDELVDGIVDFVASSQTYEGGIAPEPFGEAHGGLSYCGFAALCILNQPHAIDLDRFVNWLTAKQMTSEGGFQGRTNKLVDNCYSFWQGATFRLLAEYTQQAAQFENKLQKMREKDNK